MGTELNLFRLRPDRDAFPRALGWALLVVAGMYLVYDVGVFVALGPDTSIAYRVLIMLAMAAFPLPALVAPATYFAALDAFDLYGEHGPGCGRANGSCSGQSLWRHTSSSPRVPRSTTMPWRR